MIGLGLSSFTLDYLTRNVPFLFLQKFKLPLWMMGGSRGFQKMRKFRFYGVLCVAIMALSLVQFVESQSFDTNNGFANPADLPLMTQLAKDQLYNLSNIMSQDLGHRASFCVKDARRDWDRAFNFSSNLDFVSSCIQKVKGDPSRRLCTAAEVEFYFDSILDRSKSTNFLKLNRNCNLTSWVSGCEPGWACSVGSNEKIDLWNSQVIPERTLDCQSCCEGFFCPHGITCMIPCPLGSYCPLATLNITTGVCEPYLYQLPLGQQNHTCGGANIWADVGTSPDIFCPAGSYCPTNTRNNSCSDGHYCRMGSTYEENCFKLSSCNSNSQKQNIHVQGIMLLVGLSVLLLVIYNCSDQVLTIRERRISKSREAAAQSARTRARARQRWKSVKDAAKKNVRQLQVQLSHITWKKDLDSPDRVQIKHETDELLSSSHEGTSNFIVEESRNVQVEHIQETHEIENKHGHHIGKGMEDLASEIHIPEGKHATHTQIFTYAYEQLEKERAQEEENKNLTFSGVIRVAKDVEIKKRPIIEISFKDLTLTLKKKKQHLLRCVTGKIKPGRITAVMGPSGAGKTTFLSALVGKTFGFKMTGSILINGKNDSIHSYKKIIGFVPQDDIVHGNLTVEENLRFSARCKLPAEMSEANKVLVLERVIESLGLQAVRNSLVGTVEKRGISGGQRKRVNVGLEMVMEPSLLILDEPTSGLDSASSMLLLRALRRETQEGVNICMVVHQPSYSLFQMFDELVLLAKGGLVVYHGSTRKVEEYFASLGINVPERVNPPDHFIDILEGLVKPGTSEVSFKELPVKWMRHKGYTVPPDMQIDENGVESPEGVDHSDETNHGGDTIAEKSFAGELWHEVRSTMEHKRDKIMHNFSQSKDLSHRRTPGVFRQYIYYLGRVGKQRLRESRLQGIDYLILLLAGACLGSITNVSDENFGIAGYTYSIIAISLLCKIASLRTFSLDKLQYWRESSSGMSSLAYFIAKDTVDHFNTLIKPAIYLSMFYFFTNPRSSFGENYVVLLCLVYCVTGIAYALAIIFQPGAAQLWSVLLPVVLTLVATQDNDSAIMKVIVDLCYPKWALQAFILGNAERYDAVWLITRCAVLQKSGYNINEWGLSLSILIVYGVIFRIIAYLWMVIFKKK